MYFIFKYVFLTESLKCKKHGKNPDNTVPSSLRFHRFPPLPAHMSCALLQLLTQQISLLSGFHRCGPFPDTTRIKITLRRINCTVSNFKRIEYSSFTFFLCNLIYAVSEDRHLNSIVQCNVFHLQFLLLETSAHFILSVLIIKKTRPDKKSRFVMQYKPLGLRLYTHPYLICRIAFINRLTLSDGVFE